MGKCRQGVETVTLGTSVVQGLDNEIVGRAGSLTVIRRPGAAYQLHTSIGGTQYPKQSIFVRRRITCLPENFSLKASSIQPYTKR